MKTLKPIRKGEKEYSLSLIQEDDAATLEHSCAGFIHGGKLDYLESILNAGRLRCSDDLRAQENLKLARDVSSKGPDGQGVYFRFVPSGIRMETILNTFTGPGSAGGFFMFMPSRNLEGLSFLTMSAGDYKYSNPLTLEKMISIASDTRSCIRKGLNNSEIAFYREVPLSKISEIYIVAQSAQQGSNIDRLLISKGYCPGREEGDKLWRLKKYPAHDKVCYLRYRRTGAAAAIPSASALPSLYEAPSRRTDESRTAQPASESSKMPSRTHPTVLHLPDLYNRTPGRSKPSAQNVQSGQSIRFPNRPIWHNQ